jgi:Fe-S-cluster-containing hydrogenase component 2
MPRKKAVNPPAELPTHEGDVRLPLASYEALSLLRKSDNPHLADPGSVLRHLSKFPNTAVLRCYEEGEPICRQRDDGWTAFYTLTAEDVQAVLQMHEKDLQGLDDRLRQAAEAGNQEQVRELEAIRALDLSALRGAAGGSGPVATVYVDSAGAEAPRRTGWLDRLFGRGSRGREPAHEKPLFISAGGVSVPYGDRKDAIGEGKLFGTWACQYGRPRSATIVVERKRWFVLEVLRNVVDQIVADARYRDNEKKLYITQTLTNHLRNLSFFRDLDEGDLAPLKEAVELVSVRDGTVIFDRGDPPDSVYIVRQGLVKVMLNDWPLLDSENVLDWSVLAGALGKEADANPARAYLAGRLPDWLRERLAQGGVTAENGPALLRELNALLKQRTLTGSFTTTKAGQKFETAPALKALVDEPGFQKALGEVLPKSKRADRPEWSDQDWRLYNRLVLERACPGALRHAGSRGSENILTYLGEGEFFGEIGVVEGVPRSATCVAYVHPRPAIDELDDVGDRWRHEREPVELVRIPGEVFRRLCERPQVRARVEQEIARRKARSVQKKQTRSWADREPVYQSDRFQEQGLIQGQQLMLIDLDRCTRCDECVQACIHSHDDGRSRLFLYGDRFGRYLVPTTCRSCRNPVCVLDCPVASIKRGPNRQIVIEDWCIGCERCARNCPYDSIQMHDQGIIPESGHGWLYQRADALAGQAWYQPGYSTRGWHAGSTPLVWDHDMQAELGLRRRYSDPAPEPVTLCLRREFELSRERLARPDAAFAFTLTSQAAEIQVEGKARAKTIKQFVPVWLNGQPLGMERWKAEGADFSLELSGEERRLLRAGKNVIAVQLTPPAAGGTLLALALDEVLPNGAVFPLRAVVCDLCSNQPGQQPACVHACPHEAAMRVDSLVDFPVA